MCKHCHENRAKIQDLQQKVYELQNENDSLKKEIILLRNKKITKYFWKKTFSFLHQKFTRK